MGAIDVSGAVGDAVWDGLVARHPHGHLLQSSGWGRARSARGWSLRRVVVRDESGAATACAQMLLRRTVAGTVAYVPRGPVCAPDDPALGEVLAALRRLSGALCMFLRLEPHWPDEAATRAVLTAVGMRETEATQPASTVRIDLTRSDEALLGGMKQKWRYNVRLAERSGISVVVGDDADLPRFEALMAITARRDMFAARAGDYYSGVWRAFEPSVRRLYLALHAGEPIAAIMVFHYGDTATYLYGASADLERQRMPNHLLQWTAMRAARADGRRWYDMWGIPDEIGRAAVRGVGIEQVPDGTGGLWGVWRFKRGFGGEIHRSVGAWDDVRRPALYRLATKLVPALRATWRRSAARERAARGSAA